MMQISSSTHTINHPSIMQCVFLYAYMNETPDKVSFSTRSLEFRSLSRTQFACNPRRRSYIQTHLMQTKCANLIGATDNNRSRYYLRDAHFVAWQCVQLYQQNRRRSFDDDIVYKHTSHTQPFLAPFISYHNASCMLDANARRTSYTKQHGA